MSLSDDVYELNFSDEQYAGSIADLSELETERGIFWTSISVPQVSGAVLVLGGIPNARAEELMQSIVVEVKRIRIAKLIANFDIGIEPVLTWTSNVRSAVKTQFESRGWLTHQFQTQQLNSKPQGIGDLLSEPEVIKHIDTQSEQVKGAVMDYIRAMAKPEDREGSHHSALANHSSALDWVIDLAIEQCNQYRLIRFRCSKH